MAPLGRKIFGMSKEEYINKYSSKMVVQSGDYYNINLEVKDKTEELVKISEDKKVFQSKLNKLCKLPQLPMQLQSTNNMRPRVNNNNNNNNEFDMFFNMMQRMEYQHQNKLKDLRKQINALKAQKFVTEELLSQKQVNVADLCSQKLQTGTAQTSELSSCENDKELRDVYPNGHHFPCSEEMWV